MFYEYAVEPAALSNWQDFRYIIEKFGWQHGRLIARYPKRWKRLVYESLHGCSPMERKRIEERLTTLDHRMIARAVRNTYDPARPWLENAVMEHQVRPFRAILAASAVPSLDAVLPVSELDEDSAPLWSAPEELVLRRAPEIVTAVALLLEGSSHICLVDPYFDPDKLRFRQVFATITERVFASGRDRARVKLELHTSVTRCFARHETPTAEEERRVCSHLQARCRERLASLLPAGVRLKVTVWKERLDGQEIHNRFILTDQSGAMLGTGLDESERPTTTTTDDVHRMPEEQYRRRWCEYVGPDLAFDEVVPAFEIIGTG
jgi:hypothetical protein